MSNAATVSVRMDQALKDSAESILKELGISSSGVVQMLYRQIVLQRGVPFDLKLPENKPVSIAGMTQEQLDVELLKGVSSLKAGKRTSAEDVDGELAQEFGI